MNGLARLVLLTLARWLTVPVPGVETMSVAEALPLIFGVGGLVYVLFNLRDAVVDRWFQEDLPVPNEARVIVAKGQVSDEQARLITLICILLIYAQSAGLSQRAPTGGEGAQILLAQTTGPLLATVAVAALSINSWRRRHDRLRVRRLLRHRAPESP